MERSPRVQSVSGVRREQTIEQPSSLERMRKDQENCYISSRVPCCSGCRRPL